MCLGVGVGVVAVHEGDVPREGINVLQQFPEAKPPPEVEILVAHDRITARVQGSGFRVQGPGSATPQSGTTSSFSSTLICATSCRIPASASTNQGHAKGDSIALGGLIPEAKPPLEVEILVAHDRIAVNGGNSMFIHS